MVENFNEILKELKESDKLECKLAKNTFPKEALNTYSAFANTDGGILVLGIEEKDNRLIPVGVNDVEKIKKDMFDILNNSARVNKNIINDKNINIEKIEGKAIIFIKVPRASYLDKPIYLNGNPHNSYKRNHEGDYKCSAEEVKIMIRDSSENSLDSTLLTNFSISDFDKNSMRDYRERFASLKPEHPFVAMKDEEFFKKLGALRENREKNKVEATLGGVLVFGKTEVIKEILPHFFLEYIDKSDIREERWKDRVIYDGNWGEGNLYNFFFLVIQKLYKNLNNSFKIGEDGVTRKEFSDVHIALREAFVNSIIHADFRIEEGIKIIKYPKYYEFQNPGELRISKNDFFKGEHSKPRNNIIQEIFRFINLCERAGSGIPKILKAVKEEAFKYPEIEEIDGKFIFRFWNTGIIDNCIGTNLEEKRILEYLVKNNTITNKEAREKLGLSKHEATDTCNKLLHKKYIEKIGTGKGTYYQLKYSEDEKKMKLLENIDEAFRMIKNKI